MPVRLDDKLVVCITSRALFDCSEDDKVFQEQGIDRYIEHQAQNVDTIFKTGVGFPLVKALLGLNSVRSPLSSSSSPATLSDSQLDKPQHLVEVVLLTRNNAATTKRFIQSLQHHGLMDDPANQDSSGLITRLAFTDGTPAAHYLKCYSCDLFVSTDEKEVRIALEAGFAACTVAMQVSSTDVASTAVPSDAQESSLLKLRETSEKGIWSVPNQVRIAFDGDGVLFSDQAENEYASGGINQFNTFEHLHAAVPLPIGPMKKFATKLNNVRAKLHPSHRDLIRTFLVTARGGPAAIVRATSTLASWGLHINESLFLQGLDKGPFLQVINPHIFFDDSQEHIESANAKNVRGTAHVPFGTKNTPKVSPASEEKSKTFPRS